MLTFMITLDGPDLIVRRSDDNITEHSGNDGSGVGVTPHQHDFCTDEISGASDDGPFGVPSKDDDGTWPTPSALKRGHSFGGGFESNVDMGKDSDSDSESEHAGRGPGMRERGKCNTTTNV